MLFCLEISQLWTPIWWLLHADSCQWLNWWYYFCLISQSGYSSYLQGILELPNLVMICYQSVASISLLLFGCSFTFACYMFNIFTHWKPKALMLYIIVCVKQKRILTPWLSGHKRQWICLLITIQNEHLVFVKKISKLPPGVQTHHMLGAHGVGPGVDKNSIHIWYFREVKIQV